MDMRFVRDEQIPTSKHKAMARAHSARAGASASAAPLRARADARVVAEWLRVLRSYDAGSAEADPRRRSIG
jgi:hypothetical protein